MIDIYIERSRVAGRKFESLDQGQVDLVVRALGKFVYDNAEDLAKRCVEETGMGNIPDKTLKCRGKASAAWWAVKGKPSRGVIKRDEETGIIEIAKPLGVLGCVTPTTNPGTTAMCNAMYAFKGANTVIIAPHPRSKNLIKFIAGEFRALISALGDEFGIERDEFGHGLEDIYLNIDEPSIELTNQLMQKVDAIVATGGPGMVSAAYSSGHPSFGVGAGNVQVILDQGIDLEAEIAKVVQGRAYDNGMICAAEQNLIVHSSQETRAVEILRRLGCFYSDRPEDVHAAEARLFPGGVIAKEAVGQNVQEIAKLAKIEGVDKDTRAIVLKPSKPGDASPLNKEKMFPILSLYTFETFDDALQIAKQNLAVEGAGHTVAIHSNDDAHILRAGVELPVSRVTVNQVNATNAGGSFENGLNPTTTLGCGSWGNNSLSENLFYTHLLNITRIAYRRKQWHVPDYQELWRE
jgi:succinate-semialdehyde dehydrogenase